MCWSFIANSPDALRHEIKRITEVEVRKATAEVETKTRTMCMPSPAARWLRCPDCLKDFNKNPAKLLKMIDDVARKKSASSKPGSSHGPVKSPDPTVPSGRQH